MMPVIMTIFAIGMLLHALIPAPAHAQSTWTWEVPIDEAWEYGASWHWNPDTDRIQGYLRPQIIVESVEEGVIEGRIAAPSGATLDMYDDSSRVVVIYGYDTGLKSRPFVFIPEEGEFSIQMPNDYLDADYVKLWINGHSFDAKPSGVHHESGVSTITASSTNQTSTSTFVADDDLEGTIETVVTEESSTTTEVNVGKETAVTVTTIKSLITETTTVTTPKPASHVSAAAEEEISEYSTASNFTSTTSTSVDGRVTTVTDILSTISSKTETASTEESFVRITTVNTNNTNVITETRSLAYATDLITIWDNDPRHFKIDGYFIFDGEFWENTSYQARIPVVVTTATTEYRLAQ